MRPVFFLCKYRDNFKNLLGRLKIIQHLWSLSDHLPRLFTFLSVVKHDCQGWSLFFLYGKNFLFQNTTWSNCFRNIIKVSNSSDPNSLGPNCLLMLSVENTLARVKKKLGYLKTKSAHMILISGSHQRRMPRFKSASKAPSFLFTFPKISRSPK